MFGFWFGWLVLFDFFSQTTKVRDRSLAYEFILEEARMQPATRDFVSLKSETETSFELLLNPSLKKSDAQDSTSPRLGLLHSAIGCVVHLAQLVREKVTYLIILPYLQSVIHMKQSCKGKAAHNTAG